MKVQVLVGFSDEVRSYEPGDYAEFADDKAARFIKQELVVAASAPVTEKKGAKLEAAALADAEKRG
jgi:hypothetical protein